MSPNDRPAPGVQSVRGSCHCGAVRFEARIDLGAGFRCNCSICSKLGSLVGTAEAGSFRCVAGEGDLQEYRFGPKVLTRFFCRHCGVMCFAKSDPTQVGAEDINVNLNTLDALELSTLPVVYFDGRHDKFEARSDPWPMFPSSPAPIR